MLKCIFLVSAPATRVPLSSERIQSNNLGRVDNDIDEVQSKADPRYSPPAHYENVQYLEDLQKVEMLDLEETDGQKNGDKEQSQKREKSPQRRKRRSSRNTNRSIEKMTGLDLSGITHKPNYPTRIGPSPHDKIPGPGSYDIPRSLIKQSFNRVYSEPSTFANSSFSKSDPKRTQELHRPHTARHTSATSPDDKLVSTSIVSL